MEREFNREREAADVQRVFDKGAECLSPHHYWLGTLTEMARSVLTYGDELARFRLAEFIGLQDIELAAALAEVEREAPDETEVLRHA